MHKILTAAENAFSAVIKRKGMQKMERNENGIPTPSTGQGNNVIEEFFGTQNGGCGCNNTENGDTGMGMMCDNQPLAYAYVPWQKWRLMYSPAAALKNGTLFEELNKPLGVYGNEWK